MTSDDSLDDALTHSPKAPKRYPNQTITATRQPDAAMPGLGCQVLAAFWTNSWPLAELSNGLAGLHDAAPHRAAVAIPLNPGLREAKHDANPPTAQSCS
ncbi:hypothetical protein AB7008_21200 [Bradyrhizobium sp. 521_C7_N1_3]|uniref:hypothetical protein n=1 Tax=Bradyrhizobium TaxID=374 RepID=UPI001BA8A4FF|nr:hypothetical protein [Bradyrhizobium japonicum]